MTRFRGFFDAEECYYFRMCFNVGFKTMGIKLVETICDECLNKRFAQRSAIAFERVIKLIMYFLLITNLF